VVSVSGDEVADDRIQPALHALLEGDVEALRAAIAADPEVVNLSWQGNTLLEWATQPPHGIDPTVVQVLIDHGANLDRALNLAGCWNLPDLCLQLLAAGADPRARSDADITPLESAAMHGSTNAADVLTGYGLHRPSLWLAAAAGRLDLVRSWVDAQGTLTKHPGPYRPSWADVGRPPGAEPTDDPDEIIGEALVFAAANGRTGVVDYLLDAGASVDARPYRNTTGLHLAIQFHKPEMVRHLLARGASTDLPDDEYGSDAAGWAAACDDGSTPAATIVALLTSRQGSNRDD
jgi:ankyrin repeat protein